MEQLKNMNSCPMSFGFGLIHNVTDHQSWYLGVPWCTVVTRIALSARCPILSHNVPDNLQHIYIVRRSGLIIAYLPFVPKNLRFSPLPWSQTLGPEEPQRLKVNGVDAALEEEEVNPGKGGWWHCPINELWIYRETAMQSSLRH